MDVPDVLEQTPAGGSAMAPSDGAYGEKEALHRLEAELPMAQEQPAPDSPFGEISSAGAPAGGGIPPSPSGIPDVLMRPSAQPETPVWTPLDQGPINPVASAVDARQRRLKLMDAVANSPRASRETREWAARVRDLLVEASVE